MGEDALNAASALTSRWNAADYGRVGAFVPALGAAALDLLDPKPGEQVLDIGCGDGVLTARIAARGAHVVGIDRSRELLDAARAAGLSVVEGDAAAMPFDGQFDAAFSNAALHWMVEPDRVAAAVFRALRPGGRFAGEMGGEGNLAALREALDTELIARGYPPPAEASHWYPSVERFAAVYEQAGFEAIDARSIERPTPLEAGVAAWVLTFRQGLFDRVGVPDEERPAIAEAVADQYGSDIADYVRLRFIMRKPD